MLHCAANYGESDQTITPFGIIYVFNVGGNDLVKAFYKSLMHHLCEVPILYQQMASL